MSRRWQASLAVLLIASLAACGDAAADHQEVTGQGERSRTADGSPDEGSDTPDDASPPGDPEADERADEGADEPADAQGGTSLQRSTTESATSIEVWVHDTLTSLGAELRDSDTVVSLPDRVLFEFDEAQVKPEGLEVLDDLVEVLAQLGDVQARIEGHTDSRGAAEYNQELSERRAQAVMDHLVAGGVDASRLTAEGFGAAQPVAPNETADGEDDPDGRAQNRRVEIVFEGVDLDDLAP